MNYADALRWVYALAPRTLRLGTGPMKRALELRGHPEQKMRYAHVAGTNGKGSVCAMLECALRRAGYRTGLYSSPHLHRYVERARIAGRPVSERKLAQKLSELRLFLGHTDLALTFFEVTTLTAFELFAEAQCDIVVLETGLGGRLDATNVITPIVSVITSIGVDHTALLGDSISQIAAEKGGIIKQGVPLVMGAMDPEATAVLRRITADMNAPLWAMGAEFSMSENGESVAVQGNEFALTRPSLVGAHQANNRACTVAALVALRERGIAMSDREITTGVTRAKWPGRLEMIQGAPAVLLDAAHNEQGARALAAHVGAMERRGPRVLLFGAMRDKGYHAMLRVLRPHFDHIVYAAVTLERAAEAALFTDIAPGHVATSVSSAFETARDLAGPSGLVVVAGSIFVMAEVRAQLLHLRQDPPIAM